MVDLWKQLTTSSTRQCTTHSISHTLSSPSPTSQHTSAVQPTGRNIHYGRPACRSTQNLDFDFSLLMLLLFNKAYRLEYLLTIFDIDRICDFAIIPFFLGLSEKLINHAWNVGIPRTINDGDPEALYLVQK
jgi:hypothetical protein